MVDKNAYDAWGNHTVYDVNDVEIETPSFIVVFLNPISWLTFLGGILGAVIQGNWGEKMLLA